MMKKIVLILAVGTFFLGIAISLWATSPCRSFYSKCTEGGCGQVVTATECKMDCLAGDITCSTPEAIQ